ncbi:adenylyl cyclase [Petropleomorpha daqingensis]|uniref:Adenylyl cyclase n=1 Tax=Petropleomorpha daqingensis TaxID=2026353 RepID=A0A853CF92_9ACTN|nr:adenylyl cyclase [Petropleomorpha daqingensis]NYJ05242.1 hypothetical protein [Petropleomorpha daqingensis]
MRIQGARGTVRSVLVGTALVLAVAVVPAGTAGAAPPAPPGVPDLGPNVHVFDPSMPVAEIQAAVDAVYARQVDNQFGTERDALLFLPGTYGSEATPLDVRVGYYTEVAGLGQDPGAVTINGGVTATGQNGSGALNTFWRSVSNLTIHVVPTADGCHTGNEMWAVSQAAPMRRVHVEEYTTFMPYCENPNFASGGFVADSRLQGGALNGSQQQFYVRNSDLGAGWSNGVWNQVFSGDLNAPPQDFGVGPNQYTTLATTPVSREKPYLYVDASGRWNVFVPSAQQNSVGTTWAAGHTPGRSIPIGDFFVATPNSSLAKINSALAQGKNLLLTPGVYDVDRTIAVKRADTVVLGLGLATLTAQNGATALSVADVQGVDIAGLTIDAGPVNSRVLMQVGSGQDKGGPHVADPANPTALQDVFFRIGGPHLGKATVSLEVNSDHVVLDDIWAWRADHGNGVGWTQNTADTGLVVNGDDVTATGLFVEHYQKYEVIWNGERGRTVFFQNELPYDPPSQAAWQHDGIPGWAAYKVGDQVRTHQGWGMGSYIFMNQGLDIHEAHSFEVPVTPGVQMRDLVTVFLDPTNGNGTIEHVVNDTGGSASKANPDVPVDVISYP